MNDYLAAILFFLPAGIANAAPVFANRLPFVKDWKTPMDFGLKWRGKRIFGDNKRWRGLVFGTVMSSVSAIIISQLNANTVVTIPPAAAGGLLGFGALIGDAIESFLKRQFGVSPGDSWFPYDQADYIIGGLLLIYPFVRLPLWAITTIFIVYFVLHLVVSYFGYRLGLKDKPI